MEPLKATLHNPEALARVPLRLGIESARSNAEKRSIALDRRDTAERAFYAKADASGGYDPRVGRSADLQSVGVPVGSLPSMVRAHAARIKLSGRDRRTLFTLFARLSGVSGSEWAERLLGALNGPRDRRLRAAIVPYIETLRREIHPPSAPTLAERLAEKAGKLIRVEIDGVTVTLDKGKAAAAVKDVEYQRRILRDKDGADDRKRIHVTRSEPVKVDVGDGVRTVKAKDVWISREEMLARNGDHHSLEVWLRKLASLDLKPNARPEDRQAIMDELTRAKRVLAEQGLRYVNGRVKVVKAAKAPSMAELARQSARDDIAEAEATLRAATREATPETDSPTADWTGA